ncbi:hypothetical protein THRCLA_22997 [Thraustotheca clavata]|uniref:Uncharacterized protein n=1 Tax=Thraustotheca clavata TaxID=74557 RepID=A0A1V9YJK6_9STRA|nr:hypothetical protein THRCLA_22997 [Thraustotheca clavata]
MGIDSEAIAQVPEAISYVETRINRLKNDSLSFFKELDEAIDQGLSIQDLLVVNSSQFPALRKHWDENGPEIPPELIEAFNAYKKACEEAQQPAITAESAQSENNHSIIEKKFEMEEVNQESTASEGDAELSSAQATPISQSTAVESEEIPLESSMEQESTKAEEEENSEINESIKEVQTAKDEKDEKDEKELKNDKDEDNINDEKEVKDDKDEDKNEPEKEVKAGKDEDKIKQKEKATTKAERKLSDGVDTSGGSSNNTPQRVSSRIRNRLDQAAASSPKTQVVKQLTADDFDSEDFVPLVNLRKRSAPSPSKAEAKSSESESPLKRTSARGRQKATKEQIPPSRISARNEAKLKRKKNEKNEDESEESEVTPSRRKSTRKTVTRKRKTDDSE